MSLEEYLDERDATAERSAHQRVRDHDALAWANAGQPPEARLLDFDRWLRRELATRLDWAWAGGAKEKRIEQCRLQVDGMVLGLWRRGWLLDGRRLADRITGMLDSVAAVQRKGSVVDFWSYFKATVDRYVGLNAEEIQAEAMSAGTAIANVFQALAKRLPGGPALPELVAQRTQETLRDSLARRRRLEAVTKTEKAQLRLF